MIATRARGGKEAKDVLAAAERTTWEERMLPQCLYYYQMTAEMMDMVEQ
jgi:hypothetical protein